MIKTSESIGFPKELLQQSIQERKAYFESCIIQHPKLVRAFEDVKRKIISNRSPIVFFFGPSGVGKSTLLLKLRNEIIENSKQVLELDKGIIPVVHFEANASESAQFSWAGYYRSALVSLNEILIDHKILPSSHENFNLDSSIRKTISALRSSYITALHYRRPDAVIVDEAQHIAKVAKASRLQGQMDVIKSLSNITRIPHLLTGTYEILVLRNLSAQLSNRSSEVHLSRYDCNVQKELSEFLIVLRTFIEHLPVTKVDLIDHWEFIYERSLGLVGILKKWLERALDLCLSESNNWGNELTIDHMINTAFSVKTCNEMMEEILTGEKQLTDTESDRILLKSKLGLSTIVSSNTLNENNSSTKEKKQKRKPGQRKPTRDKVGVLV